MLVAFLSATYIPISSVHTPVSSIPILATTICGLLAPIAVVVVVPVVLVLMATFVPTLGSLDATNSIRAAA